MHEIKFDGYRLQAQIRGGKAKLLTRSGHDWTDRFGAAIAGALAALPVGTAILDGELVVEGPGGASDFSALQADLSASRTDRFLYYAFDLLYLDGDDLRGEPLRVRKDASAQLLHGARRRRCASASISTRTARSCCGHACRLSLEGLVSKQRDGRLSRPAAASAWVKSKCSRPPGVRDRRLRAVDSVSKAVGSLVLGYYEDGKLVHAGRVGTGFTAQVARDIARAARAAAAQDAALRREADRRRGARRRSGSSRELVAEVEFRAWTADGILRHAAFRGLREDKPAREIVREAERVAGQAAAAQPQVTPDPSRPGLLAGRRRHQAGPRRLLRRGLAADGALRRQPAGGAAALPGRHRGPVLLPEARLEGPEPRDPAPSTTRRTTTTTPLVAIDGLPGLIGLVQGGALEIHTWQSTLDDLEQPDQIVMDLDPGEGVPWTGGHRRRARGPRPASRTPGSPASSRPRAARVCTSSRR